MKKQLLTLLTTTSFILLIGCADNASTVKNTVDTVETAQTESTVESQETEFESMEDADMENTEEATEPITEQTMEEWLTETGKQETICMAVWNDANSTKHIIENEETYERQEGDRFFICTPSCFENGHSTVVINYEFGKPTDNYLEVILGGFKGTEDIFYEVNCSNGEQGTIHFSLVSSGTAITSSETVDASLPGLQWTMKLGLDTPKIVVYNDTTGFKQILDEGATYQMCEGDELAIYLPENYTYVSTNMGEDNLSLIVNVVWMNWTGVDLGNGFTFEAIAQNTDTSEQFVTHATLLPIQ